MSYQMLGLGDYKANDPLSKEIIARKGDTSEASLQAYGQIAGAMGGAAVCTAFGAAAAAPACGIVGGLVIGWIASQIPVAHGSTIEDVVVETWKKWQGPNLKWSQRAMLAVKAYYVMRELAIDQAVAAGATQTWAETYLQQNGLVLEPSSGRWAPRPERYNHPLACTAEPCADTKSIVGSAVWSECGAANKVGIPLDCRTYAQLTYGPWPPIAGKGDKIDWGLVAWDEISFERGNKACVMPTFGGKTIAISCPQKKPSAWASANITKLKYVAAKMVVDAKNPNMKYIQALLQVMPVKEPMSPVAKTVVVAGGAGLLWWLGKKLLF